MAVGRGHIVVTSVDLAGYLEARPVARQLRHSLLAYLSSNPDQPATQWTEADLETLLRRD
jgi:hypothetical protein